MKRILLLVAVVALMAAPAMADINAAWTNSGMSWTGVTVVDPRGPVTGTHNTSTGMSLFTEYPTPAYPDVPFIGNGSNQFYAFCVDLRQYVDTSTHPFAIVAPSAVPMPAYGPPMEQPMGVARAARLEHFFSKYYGFLSNGVNDTVERQAFQLAVWEIVYEDGPVASYSLSGGSLYVSSGASAAVTKANAWFSDASWQTATGLYVAGLQDLREGSYGQDFVTVVPHPIPVPGAALLGLLGFSLISRIKRRFA